MSEYPQLHRYDHFCIDTETTGLSILNDNLFGISISLPDGRDFYWDVRQAQRCLGWLADSVKDYNGTIVAHHASFDWHMLRKAGVWINPLLMDDTMIRAALIDEHLLNYQLNYLGNKYIGRGKSDEGLYEALAGMFGGSPTKKAQMKNLHKAPISLVQEYAIGDSRVTLDLYEWQNQELDRQNLWKVLRLERDLFEVVCDLEMQGVKVDLDRAHDTAKKLGKEIKTKQHELDKMIGREVNVNPSTSLTQAMVQGQDRDGNWRALDGTLLNETPTGKPQLNSEALLNIKHPAAALVLDIRKLRKLKETFIEGHILGHEKNGRVHGHINQTKTDSSDRLLGTGTGRLSMSAPALQQIHKRDKALSALVRSIFIPDYLQDEWASLDYSQSDLRFFAHYTRSETLLRELRKNPDADIHQITADLMGIQRNPGPDGTGANAKQMGLAQVFGMGVGLLAKEMGLPYEEVPSYWDPERTMLKGGEEAQELSDLYHAKITGAKEFAKDAERLAKARGWVRSIMGRKMHFPRGQFAHKAAGYLYQSGTAEAIKTKMVETWRLIRDEGLDARMLLSVHDELNFSIGDKGVVAPIKDAMEDFYSQDAPFRMRVPMRVEAGVGPNWFEAS